MCGAFRGRDLNRISPVTDLPSEKIEIRKDRWLRVIHYKPHLSRSDSGFGREDVQSINSEHSVSSGHGLRDPEHEGMVAVFFIHGFGGSADLWYEQVKHFSQAGYEVLAPDLLGHGQSSAPRNSEDYTFSELCKDLLNLFDRYHKKSNVLVGHSYGASFCSVIASERDSLVSKMVLIAGGAPVPLVGTGPCDLFCLPTPVLYCIKPFCLGVFERRAYDRHMARSIRKKIKAFSAPIYVLKAVMAGQMWTEGDEAYHKKLMVPALLIYGSKDKLVTIEEELHMKEAIHGSLLEVIDNTGHMVMVERPTRVNTLIHNFLQQKATTRSSCHQSCDVSAEVHDGRPSDESSSSRNVTTLQEDVPVEGSNEQARRHSSGMSLGPHPEENTEDIGRDSRASLAVPKRRSSADEVKKFEISQQEGSEI